MGSGKPHVRGLFRQYNCFTNGGNVLKVVKCVFLHVFAVPLGHIYIYIKRWYCVEGNNGKVLMQHVCEEERKDRSYKTTFIL